MVVAAAPAGAHALAQSSDPAAGATLKQAPSTVTIVFGETPDPRLSLLRVLDSAGQDHSSGPTHTVPSDPRVLQVGVGKLADGVYTVSWRTVSKVDGHLAAGAFAFGVGVTPTATISGTFSSKAPNPSPLGVAARWLLYSGVMVLVGGAFVAVVCYPRMTTRLVVILAGAAGLAAVGVVVIAVDSRQHAHLAWSQFLGSSLGDQFLWRAIPIAVAAAVTGAALRVTADRLRRILVGVAGLVGLVAMWGDVVSSHAAAAHTLRLARMGSQWAHFAAAGIWAGGLAALLATIGTVESDLRVRAVRRFSAAALTGAAVMAATGFQRAYDEVGSLHSLVHAAFGEYVLAKIALFVALVALGAVNRFRSIGAVPVSTRPLRRIGGIELVALVGVLAATAILQGLAPPTSSAVAAAVHPLVLRGHDFGTTARVTLTISPGLVGFNRFTLTAVDYDTGRPAGTSAALGFTRPDRPDLGSSSLALPRTGPGRFAANGANLSIDGTWTVTLGLQDAAGGVEIPFEITPRQPPEKIVVAPQGPGIPTLYTLELPGNRSVQTYLDPAHPGFNEWHTTFIGADGNEIPMTSATDNATAPGAKTSIPLTVRRLDPIGHFVADLPGAVKGSHRFDVSGTTVTGETIHGTFIIPVR